MKNKLLSGLDALLVTEPVNIRYLTGFTGLSPAEREAFVLVTQKKIYLFTGALYLEQAKKLANSQIIPPSNYLKANPEIIEVSREYPLAKKLKTCLDGLKQGPAPNPVKLGFEENDLTFAEFNKLKSELKDYALIQTQGRVEELRKIKRPDEIVYIKQAAKLTDRCFSNILSKLKQNVTESEVAWKIESFIRKNGAECAFTPIVAFNENASQPHYASSANCKLKAESLVLLDFGARVKGYCADMTRVIFVGKPKPEQSKAYTTLIYAQQAVLTYLNQAVKSTYSRGPLANGVTKPTVSGAAADKLCRKLIQKHGFPPYPHSLGHAVGLAIHEAPRLSVKRDEILLPGMIVTVEPGVYLTGKFGVRIEDLVLIKEKSVEVLSQSPKTLITL